MLRWLRHELRSLAGVTLYFALCFAVIMLLKKLWLAEYAIEFRGLTRAIFAALVTAKVLLLLTHVPLFGRLRDWPGLVEILTRSAVFTFAVLLVLLVEKAFESRAELGGVAVALANVLQHRDMPNLGATAIAVGLSFVAYNTFDVARRSIGDQRMREIFMSRHATTSQS